MKSAPMPDQGAIAWLHSYARKNYWRVAAWMEYDDLIQDGYCAWAEVCWRYPTAVDNPAHIMFMFKLCFSAIVTDRSRQKTKQQDDARSDIVDIFDGDSITMPDPTNFNLLVAKAPKIVQDTITLMTNDKMKDELNKPYEKQVSGRRETLNERLCKLLGLDAKSIDVVRETKLYFSAA